MSLTRTDDGWRVAADRRVEYEVVRADGIVGSSSAPEVLLRGGSRRHVVIDMNVEAQHGERVRRWLEHHGLVVTVQPIEVTEATKTMATAEAIEDGLARVGIKRRSEPVIAIGGGVLLDLVGLSASLYARGVPWLRVPTTLVGLIDAGIGIKTAVNFGRRKHKLGTYHAGDTILDRTLMATVSRRQVSNGLAEALKMALIKSRALFDVLEEHGRLVLEERLQGLTEVGDRAALRVLDLAVDGMLEELADNLWEEELARCVDYGHTWSPGLEMAALKAGEPGLLHGEAVALDMALCTVVAWRRGLVTEDERDRVLSVMRSLGLATWDPLLVDEGVLAGGLLGAVEHRDGHQRQPLGRGIGGHVFAGMPGSEGAAAVEWNELVGAAEALRMLSEEG